MAMLQNAALALRLFCRLRVYDMTATVERYIWYL